MKIKYGNITLIKTNMSGHLLSLVKLNMGFNKTHALTCSELTGSV
jgi:hypothetical protein